MDQRDEGRDLDERADDAGKGLNLADPEGADGLYGAGRPRRPDVWSGGA
jgi:hypothetical protein